MVTEGTTLLIITQVRSGFKKLHMPKFCKYKYLHVKICSLVIVKSMQVVVILNAKLDVIVIRQRPGLKTKFLQISL